MSARAIADDLQALLQAERGKADESDDSAAGAPDLTARSYSHVSRSDAHSRCHARFVARRRRRATNRPLTSNRTANGDSEPVRAELPPSTVRMRVRATDGLDGSPYNVSAMSVGHAGMHGDDSPAVRVVV
ncbi:hypothetical protein GCM10010402_28430 [Actinomadura luteofluorescens]